MLVRCTLTPIPNPNTTHAFVHEGTVLSPSAVRTAPLVAWAGLLQLASLPGMRRSLLFPPHPSSPYFTLSNKPTSYRNLLHLKICNYISLMSHFTNPVKHLHTSLAQAANPVPMSVLSTPPPDHVRVRPGLVLIKNALSLQLQQQVWAPRRVPVLFLGAGPILRPRAPRPFGRGLGGGGLAIQAACWEPASCPFPRPRNPHLHRLLCNGEILKGALFYLMKAKGFDAMMSVSQLPCSHHLFCSEETEPPPPPRGFVRKSLLWSHSFTATASQ